MELISSTGERPQKIEIKPFIIYRIDALIRKSDFIENFHNHKFYPEFDESDPTEIISLNYIGKSIQPLSQRRNEHNYASNYEKKRLAGEKTEKRSEYASGIIIDCKDYLLRRKGLPLIRFTTIYESKKDETREAHFYEQQFMDEHNSYQRLDTRLVDHRGRVYDKVVVNKNRAMNEEEYKKLL